MSSSSLSLPPRSYNNKDSIFFLHYNLHIFSLRHRPSPTSSAYNRFDISCETLRDFKKHVSIVASLQLSVDIFRLFSPYNCLLILNTNSLVLFIFESYSWIVIRQLQLTNGENIILSSIIVVWTLFFKNARLSPPQFFSPTWVLTQARYYLNLNLRTLKKLKILINN